METVFQKIGKYIINPLQITSIHLNANGATVKFSDGLAILLDTLQVRALNAHLHWVEW